VRRIWVSRQPPRSRDYRTPISVIKHRPAQGGFCVWGSGRTLSNRHHRSHLTREFLDPTVLARAHGHLLDQPAQDLEGLGPRLLAVQGIVRCK
jgi:hypothetical protein